MLSIRKLASVCIVALIGLGGPALAAYPERAVTLIVPFAPGGPTDALARIVAKSLESQTGKPFIVENVAGAGSTLGTARVAAASPDGYTLLWGSSSAMVIAPHLYSNLRYDPKKSFTPIAGVGSLPYVLMVNANSPFKTYEDLVEYGRKNPGKLNYATPGAGTSLHLTLELMGDASGFKAVHVPFKGSAPAMQALLSGDVDYLIDGPGIAAPVIQAGRVRPLAVTSRTRLPEFPDVPTLQELGLKDFESHAWFAVFGPAGLPPEIAKDLETRIANALKDPEVMQTLRNTGFLADDPRSEVLVRRLETESDRWKKVIEAKNISIQ